MNKMFTYNISKVADNKAFKKACSAIEDKVKNFKKEKLLVDVDGTLIQIYTVPDGRIKVVNDYLVDAVYADSDVDLEKVI